MDKNLSPGLSPFGNRQGLTGVLAEMKVQEPRTSKEKSARGKLRGRSYSPEARNLPDGQTADWLSSFAILGDSWAALLGSFSILVIAVAVSLKVDQNSSLRLPQFRSVLSWWPSNDKDENEKAYRRLGPAPAIDPPKIYLLDSTRFESPTQANQDTLYVSLATQEILQAFAKDGVVAVRGLIDNELMDALDRESAPLVHPPSSGKTKRKKKDTQFHTVFHGSLFQNPPVPASEIESGANTSAFLKVALASPVSRLAAELLMSTGEINGSSSTDNLRVMRDILLAKDDDEYICGWHVDDLGFWPATPDAAGVNAWIALDDMPLEHGGGFAVAVGSHDAAWRQEAHYVTGASTTFPPGGYKSVADMFAKRTGSGTCNLKQSAPHIHRRMEETKRIYPVKRGDVIFHTRWLFHRTVSFERSYVEEHQQKQQDNTELVYRRYSVRYSPGSSKIPPGYGTELSVLWNEKNGGRTADDVCRLDAPWYPQAWPTTIPSEMDGLGDLLRHKIPVAEERRAKRKEEMKPYLKQLAQEQQKKQGH